MNRNLIIWLAVAGLLTFLLMGIDKGRAKRRRERIPEAALFLSALLGGALGGTLAMLIFRHKTRHLAFVLGFPLLALLQTALVLAYLGGIIG